jgi:micrococcal nuclease
MHEPATHVHLRWLWSALVVCLMVGGQVVPGILAAHPVHSAVPTTSTAVISRVIDGDTLVATSAGINRTIRLIGVDTPETRDPRKPVQCYGREATAYTTALVLGQTVTLVADASQGDRDKYGRLLRSVVLADGTDVALQLISDGYGFEYTYTIPYANQITYRAAQRDARTAQRGLWAPTTCNGVVTAPTLTRTRSATRTPTRTRTATPPRTATATAATPSDSAAYPCRTGQIKGNTRSLIYHVPGGAYYAVTRASVRCFDSEAAAQAAGYRRSLRHAPLP